MVNDNAQAYRETIAGNLRACRARNRLSQADIAREMRVLGFRWHQQTLGRLENCERGLLAEEVIALAEILNTLPGQLLSRTPAY